MAVKVITKKKPQPDPQPRGTPAPRPAQSKRDSFIFLKRIRKVIGIMVMDVRVRFDPVLRKQMQEEYKQYLRFVELARKDQSSEQTVYGKAEKFWDDPAPASKFSLRKLISVKWTVIFFLTQLLINREALLADTSLAEDLLIILAASVILSPIANYLWNNATDAIGEVFGGKV